MQNPQRAIESMQRRLARATTGKHPTPPTALVHGPRIRFASGDVEQPYFGASIDKVLIATLIGQLVDQGTLTPETPIGQLLPAETLAHLPAAPGVDTGRAVTVDQLLAHTSGLPDVCDPPKGETSECSIAELERHPARLWTPETMLAQAEGLRPHARPGERFLYGDTGYLLLIRIIEEATGAPFAERLGTHVLEPAAMTCALEWAGASAQKVAELRPTLAPFSFTDPTKDLSQDFAMKLTWQSGLGGAASATDLLRFQQALHAGELCSGAWVERMARPRHRSFAGLHYGAGMAILRFEGFMPLLRGLPRPVGGLGILATHMFAYPEYDTHVILNFGSYRRMRASFEAHMRIARLIRRWG